MTRSEGLRRRTLLGGAVAGTAAVGVGLTPAGTAAAAPGDDADLDGQMPPGGWAAAAADVRNEMLHLDVGQARVAPPAVVWLYARERHG